MSERREPEVALAFTPDPWVEELHRHLSDHGGARVRVLVVEPTVALDESYDVLVAGHRWPSLTRALVADVHARGRAVLGVHDREEPASRAHLAELGVDAFVESDASAERFVRAIVAMRGADDDDRHAVTPSPLLRRSGRLVVIGGPPGVGRTEVAVHLAAALARTSRVALVDADDVAPAVAGRLDLDIEPNICTAVDAVEHGRGDLDACVQRLARPRLDVLAGLPHVRGWARVRPGEVLRVVDAFAHRAETVVVDSDGTLDDDDAPSGRSRHARARALVGEADRLIGVCDASPNGIVRFLGWVAHARAIATDTPLLAVVNRAPSDRYRRAELYGELRASVPLVDVVFAPQDRSITDAAWAGTPAAGGSFVRAMQRVAELVP